METIAIYESGKSEKVIKFIELSVKNLSEHCSVKYSKRIIYASENGSLWGVHVTGSGRYRAIFI